MKTIKQRFNILASLVFLLMLLCTSLDNPFQDTDNVSLKINVPEKEGGFNYCVNDKVIFEVTVIMPHLVKKISIIYDEDGNRDDQEITTNESDNKKISFSYIYKEIGVKDVKFVITFRESGKKRNIPYDIEIGVKPIIKNGKKLLTNRNIILGEPLILTIDHEKYSKASYNWYKDSKILSGENQKSLIFNPLHETDAGQYYCIVSTDWGQDTSKKFTIGFNNNIEPPEIQNHPQNIQAGKPIIKTHPLSQKVRSGNKVTFTIEASGTGPLNYQWKKSSNINISGEVNATYTIDKTSPDDDQDKFYCVVSNSAGEAVSNIAKLTLLYKVTYDINNGSGRVPTDLKSYKQGDKITLMKADGLYKKDHTFNGWTTNKDSNSSIAGGTYTMGKGDVTLYAIWVELPKCKIIFDGNGADTEADPRIMTVNKNTSINNLPKEPKKVGHKFKRWLDKNQKEFDTVYTIISDITVKADWEKETYTVKFESVEEVVQMDRKEIKVVYSEKINLNAPTGYDINKWIFLGWYNSNNSKFEDSVTIKENITFYAHFKKKENKAPQIIGKNFTGSYGGTIKITANDITIYDESPKNKIKLKADFTHSKGDQWFDISEEGNDIKVRHDLTVHGAEYVTSLDIILYVQDEEGLESNKVSCELSFE